MKKWLVTLEIGILADTKYDAMDIAESRFDNLGLIVVDAEEDE